MTIKEMKTSELIRGLVAPIEGGYHNPENVGAVFDACAAELDRRIPKDAPSVKYRIVGCAVPGCSGAANNHGGGTCDEHDCSKHQLPFVDIGSGFWGCAECSAERDGKPRQNLWPSDYVAEADLVEALAALAHEQWSGWMEYLFTRAVMLDAVMTVGGKLSDEWPERWRRQMKTSYAELSEKEKESDREEARRVIALLRKRGALR